MNCFFRTKSEYCGFMSEVHLVVYSSTDNGGKNSETSIVLKQILIFFY